MRSMTGFGRASFELDELPCDVEVRSVNHRYLDDQPGNRRDYRQHPGQ